MSVAAPAADSIAAWSVLPESAEVVDGRLRVGGVRLGRPRPRATARRSRCTTRRTLRARARAYRRRRWRPTRAPPGRCSPARPGRRWRCCARCWSEGLGADVASEGELAVRWPPGVPAIGDRARQQQVRRRPGRGGAAGARPGGGRPPGGARPARADRRRRTGVVQRVLVRVTPGITADTHRKIVTGHSDSKFGFAAGRRRWTRSTARPPSTTGAGRPARASGLADPRPRHLSRGGRVAGQLHRPRTIWASLPVLDLGGGLAVAYTDGEQAPDIATAVDDDRLAGSPRRWPPAGCRCPS